MEKKEKIFTALGVAVLVGGVVAKVIKTYKAETKKIEDQKKAEKEEIESCGVDPDLYKEKVEKPDGNLVKRLFVATRWNAGWDMDVIDPVEAVHALNVIHIMQGRTAGRDQLDFVFEIPDYFSQKSPSSPRIGDFIRTFGDAAEHLWKNIVIFSPRPSKTLEGYMAFTIDNKDSKILKLDPCVYAPWSDGTPETRDGLSKFYETAMSKGGLKEHEISNICNWIREKLGLPSDSVISLEYVFLGFRITFPIQIGTENPEMFGITMKTALDSLKYLTEEMVVTRKGVETSKEVKYDHILFHSPNEETGKWDMTDFYSTTKENGKELVFIDGFDFTVDEED